jgi:hypothetical protein
MIDVSFREKIVSLQQDWAKDQYNMQRSYDFWYVMDSISDELTLKWAERAIKHTQPINNAPADPSEWLAVCNIIHAYKNSDDPKLTPGQKRKCLFQVIRVWDNLEIEHFSC